MITLRMTEQQHSRLLALVRCQALIERTVDWDEAVELLETDRPRWGTVTPIASRSADVDERTARMRRGIL